MKTLTRQIMLDKIEEKLEEYDDGVIQINTAQDQMFSLFIEFAEEIVREAKPEIISMDWNYKNEHEEGFDSGISVYEKNLLQKLQSLKEKTE
jgi:hypothetical protein